MFPPGDVKDNWLQSVLKISAAARLEKQVWTVVTDLAGRSI